MIKFKVPKNSRYRDDPLEGKNKKFTKTKLLIIKKIKQITIKITGTKSGIKN